MILYLTHLRDNEDPENKTYAVLSDVPFSQIQNTSFLAQSTELGTEDIVPFAWYFFTGQALNNLHIDSSKATVVDEQEIDIGSAEAFYQYKATVNGETANVLLTNASGDLSNPDDYIIFNGMYHGSVDNLSELGLSVNSMVLIRYKDIEGLAEDDPNGVSLDMITLSTANEESTSSSAASLKVKDKNGNWVDISDISIRTHGGSAQPSNPLLQTIPCYPSLDTYSGDDPYSIAPGIYDESTGESTKGKLYKDVYVFLDENDEPIILDTNDTSNVYTVLLIDCVGGQQSIHTKHSKDFIWPFLPSGTTVFDMTGDIFEGNNSTYNVWDEDTQQSIAKPQYDFAHPVYARIIDLLLGGYYGG